MGDGDGEMRILNDRAAFTCARWGAHFEQRGLFSPQYAQGSEGWLRTRRFASGSTFGQMIANGPAATLRLYEEYVRNGHRHEPLGDSAAEPVTILSQHLRRGKVGEGIAAKFLLHHARGCHPDADVHLLECPSMLIDGMDLASDSPDGALVICRCRAGGECHAAAVEIKFPLGAKDILCTHADACRRLVAHACAADCPGRTRSPFEALTRGGKRQATPPCQACIHAAVEHGWSRYYTQMMMHMLALGVDDAVFCRPVATRFVLEKAGIAEHDFAAFEALAADTARVQALPEWLFRVYAVRTPDNYVREEYRRIFDSPLFDAALGRHPVIDAFLADARLAREDRVTGDEPWFAAFFDTVESAK